MILLKDFLESTDINCNLYGVYLIKKFLEKNESDDNSIELLVNQINTGFLLLLTSLFNRKHNKLSYDILYILINVSFNTKGEELFCSDEKILLNIATFLGNNIIDSKLLTNGIWLIRNIISNKKITKILLNFQLIDFFDTIYERNLLNNELMKMIIICLDELIRYKLVLKDKKENNDPTCLLPAINIIKTQLRPNLPSDLLFKCFYSLLNIAHFNSSDVYQSMTNCKLHKEIMNLYPIIIEKINKLNIIIKNYESRNNIDNNNNEKEDEQYIQYKKDLENYNNIVLIILKILGKMMSLEDGILTQILIDSGISHFLKNALQSPNPQIIKNVSFCISNICAGTYGQMANLFENNTFIELIKVSKNIYEALDYNFKIDNEYYKVLIDAFRELNYAFSLAIMNCIYEKIIPLAKYDNYAVILILVKGLNIFSNKNFEDVIINILAALYKLILNDRGEKMDDNNNGTNFSKVMEKHGLKEYLEKLLAQSKNQKLLYDAERIYDSIFNDFEKDL